MDVLLYDAVEGVVEEGRGGVEEARGEGVRRRWVPPEALGVARCSAIASSSSSRSSAVVVGAKLSRGRGEGDDR